jgi:exonuclease VII small subunit
VYAAEKERKRRADAYPRLMEMLESIPNPPISMSPERALEEYERWHNLAIELRSELSGAELIIAIDTSGTQVPKPEDA